MAGVRESEEGATSSSGLLCWTPAVQPPRCGGACVGAQHRHPRGDRGNAGTDPAEGPALEVRCSGEASQELCPPDQTLPLTQLQAVLVGASSEQSLPGRDPLAAGHVAPGGQNVTEP